MIEKNFNVIDEAGIHARPASVLVTVASGYESEIKIIYKEKTANLKSILGVMALGIPFGEEFNINAEGSDEEEVLKKLEETLITAGLVNA
ncbi:HPr family phosphocarrier protein [Viridibacillus arvi]|uniref:Phosphocarrier protein HPr n=1 Tax=Viridibacillus arvi TaxID=263475 RepID=A0A0M0LJK9_9BACL|nr:HPr family phosphocarrier protein [Viridibacillus arvi]KOO51082.1 phosphocarrier protein HPr [Viridibacillus arvi]